MNAVDSVTQKTCGESKRRGRNFRKDEISIHLRAHQIHIPGHVVATSGDGKVNLPKTADLVNRELDGLFSPRVRV
jgi:hypothetical protein